MLEFLEHPGEDGCGRKGGGDSGIVMEDVCEDGIQNLGVRRLVLIILKAGILVGGLVVVVVGVMIVVVLG